MLSTPPAMMRSASPALIWRAAIETRAAQPVHRGAWNRNRQPREQQRHARDVAIVFAGLVGAAENDFVDEGWIEPPMPRQQRPQWHRSQIVSTHASQRPAITADGRADIVDDERFGHDVLPKNRR